MSQGAMGFIGWVPFLAGLACCGGGASFVLIRIMRPWLVRYALARPTARGLHTMPTPQGGGIAVLCACALAALVGAWVLGIGDGDLGRLASVLIGAGALAILGLVDDIRPLPALPRLAVQLVAMLAAVWALPEGTRVLPMLPFPVEQALLVVGGAWFINLTNFMDGMDWMTVVEMVPLSLTLVLFWTAGSLTAVPGLLALGLLAGLLGYAPYNRPVARLFLGDVGSLPIGYLAAYGLLSLAGGSTGPGLSPLIGALLVPLYYIADSGITLLWRLRLRQRIWEPHRNHFYQVAIARGLTVPGVLLRVAATNTALCLLAGLSLTGGASRQAFAFALGSGLVGLTLMNLSRGAKL